MTPETVRDYQDYRRGEQTMLVYAGMHRALLSIYRPGTELKKIQWRYVKAAAKKITE